MAEDGAENIEPMSEAEAEAVPPPVFDGDLTGHALCVGRDTALLSALARVNASGLRYWAGVGFDTSRGCPET